MLNRSARLYEAKDGSSINPRKEMTGKNGREEVCHSAMDWSVSIAAKRENTQETQALRSPQSR